MAKRTQPMTSEVRAKLAEYQRLAVALRRAGLPERRLVAGILRLAVAGDATALEWLGERWPEMAKIAERASVESCANDDE